MPYDDIPLDLDADFGPTRQEEIAYLKQQDASRMQRLYVSDKYKVFFVTKQPRLPLPDTDDRNAYIAIRPFKDFTPEAVKKLKAIAEPWDEAASQVSIHEWERDLVFVDVSSRTESFISISALNDDVRDKLQPYNDNALWKTYTAVASGSVGHETVAPERASFRKSAKASLKA